MKKNSRIFVAGHKGMVGSAIVRQLSNLGFSNLMLPNKDILDCMNTNQVNQCFKENKPDYVFLAAAKVGGIHANNTYPAEFIYNNLMIQSNIIHHSYLYNVKKLLFLGSSCIYPKICAQPIKEHELLSGQLEPTNSAYAVAKIAGIEMCSAYFRQYGCNFISAMPTNLYGPNDNFNLETSHVLPALLRKCHEAKINKLTKLEIWGSGKPKREFLYVDDCANACIFLMQHYSENQIINIGTGNDLSIKELAKIIQKVVNYQGVLSYNSEKPDGTPKKQLDVTRLHKLGWKHTISLEEGIKKTYNYFKKLP